MADRQTQIDDARLAKRAADGCRDSFASLVDRHGGRLLTYLNRLVADRAEAEDLTQQTLLRAWQNLSRYESRCAFSTWLFTIGHRLAISHLRTHGVRPKPLAITVERSDHHTLPPDQQAMQRELCTNLWRLAEAKLSPDACAALWLHYAQGMPLGDVARVTGKSAVGVRVCLHRARAAMFKACREAGIELADLAGAAAAPSSVQPPFQLPAIPANSR